MRTFVRLCLGFRSETKAGPDIRWKMLKSSAVIIGIASQLISYNTKRKYFARQKAQTTLAQVKCVNGNPYFCQTLGRSNHSYFIYTGHSHILTSHCTAGHAAWERGCKHFLPNEWPADSALTSLPFPPWGGTCHSSRLCGRQFQPQGYVISVHHSQQCSSHSGSAHKNTTSLANHFSCRDVLAKQDEKKKL